VEVQLSIDLLTRLAALERRVADLEGRRKKSGPFVPPTVAEVASYCRGAGLNVDAEQFCCFYGSKGWMVGTNKMKDWRMAARNWDIRHKADAPQQPAKCMPLGRDEVDTFKGW
jgi:hypothetical protein